MFFVDAEKHESTNLIKNMIPPTNLIKNTSQPTNLTFDPKPNSNPHPNSNARYELLAVTERQESSRNVADQELLICIYKSRSRHTVRSADFPPYELLICMHVCRTPSSNRTVPAPAPAPIPVRLATGATFPSIAGTMGQREIAIGDRKIPIGGREISIGD